MVEDLSLDKQMIKDVLSKEIVKPTAKRRATGYLIQMHALRKRRAYRLNRSVARFRSILRRDDSVLKRSMPTQNAFVESLDRTSQDVCLNQKWFKDLDDAHRLIVGWRRYYNDDRSHISLSHLPPLEYLLCEAGQSYVLTYGAHS